MIPMDVVLVVVVQLMVPVELMVVLMELISLVWSLRKMQFTMGKTVMRD
jgi:hypothetical protein